MGTEHFVKLVPVGHVDFEVELGLGIAQLFPGFADQTRLSSVLSLEERPRTIVLDCNDVAARRMPSERSFAATIAKRMDLPRFSAMASAREKSCCSMPPNSCSASSSYSPEAARRNKRTCNTTTSRRPGLTRSSTLPR